jgi:hypothetical protein
MLLKIPVKGKTELQFWIRAFEIEGEIQQVVDILNENLDRKTALAPVIAEREMGLCMWVYFLAVTIDSLGLIDGEGIVWLTSGKVHRDMALKERNKLGDYAIEQATKAGKFQEMIEFEPRKDV